MTDEDINALFDHRKIMKLYKNVAFEERIDAEVQIRKNDKIKIIFVFDPLVSNRKIEGTIGIVTAFRL